MATCSSADSVLDAASQIKSNATKLNDFVNGRADQTVQLGASTDTPTPTLRNLVANALEHVAESMGDSVETAIATVNELENGKADKVNGNVEDHIAALDMYGNLQDGGINMDDVAIKSVDIANLNSVKADKVLTATNGHLAGLNSSGNLTDSGLVKADVQTKLSSATANHLLSVTSSGFMADSGLAKADVQAKLTGHTAGDVLIASTNGFMVDSGIASSNVALKGTDIANLQAIKADKASIPVDGNLAELDASGNFRDAGRSVEDFASILGCASTAASRLWHTNRLSIENFDEACAQHRLLQRLFNGTVPTASSKPVLFVVSGQSNASGGGKYRPYEKATDCGWFWEWYSYPSPPDGAWVPLDPEDQSLKPLADPTGHGYYGGGWVPFARKFFQLTGRKVIILNIASGGSTVTDGGYTTENTWADNGYGTLRASRTVIWNAFSAAVPASSYDLGGILWIQGENEVGRMWSGRVTMQDYIDGTLDVWSWTRTLIGSQNCPVFVGKVAYFLSALEDSLSMSLFEDIQNQQEKFCNYTNIFPGYFSAQYFIKVPDLYYSDSAHYSAYGYNMVGEGFARNVAHYLNF